MVGDFVAYSGNLYKIDPNAPVMPFNPAAPAGPNNRPMSQQFYVSANSVEAERLEVTTAPGTVAGGQGPAYMTVFKSKIGTGGGNLTVPPNPALGIDGGVIPILEPRRDIAVRGWVTDATQLVDIFAVDVDPTSGAETDRLLGSVLPGSGFRGWSRQPGPLPVRSGRRKFPASNPGNIGQDQHGQAALGNQVGLNHAALAGLTSGRYQSPSGRIPGCRRTARLPGITLELQWFPIPRQG